MLKKMSLTVAIFLASVCGLEGRIVQTAHIEEVISLIDEETWFLVDLDNCLFESAQALGHANWFYDQVIQLMENGMSRDEAIMAPYADWVRIQKVCKVKPLEQEFVTAILNFQKRGIPVMGLTHRQTSCADSTVKQIQSLGLDFTKTAPSSETFVFPTKVPTLYLEGVVFVDDRNKKLDLFRLYLEKVQECPKKVVFIDDKLKNVEELEALSNDGIEYIGIHYTAIDRVKPVYQRDIANFQYKFLDQIMSNEAALLLMDAGLE